MTGLIQNWKILSWRRIIIVKNTKKKIVFIILILFLSSFFGYYILGANDTRNNSHFTGSLSQWQLGTEQASFPGRSIHTTTEFKDKLWIIGGWNGRKTFNDIWYSEDGIHWEQALEHAPFQARVAHTTIVYKGRLWVIGGLYFDKNQDIHDLNDVWSSADGLHWTRVTAHAPFSARGGHSTVVFKNKIYLIGGIAHGIDIWSTANGKDWIQSGNDTNIQARGGHASVVYKDKIWIIGGMHVDRQNNYYGLNDAWYSEDGTTWKLSVTNAAFFAGGGGSCAVYDNMMWVIGGYNRRGRVFVTENGSIWKNVDMEADFGERIGLNCIPFKGRLWVIGGFNGGEHKNDIWYMGRPADEPIPGENEQ